MDAVAVRAVLARAPALTAAHLHELLEAAGNDITRCIDPDTLARVALPAPTRSCLTLPDGAALDSDLRWIQVSGARLIASTEADYPPALLELPSAPPILFVLGDARAPSACQLAMVGSRNASAHGCRTAFEFAARFAESGLAVTSGLALGIDAHSHAGALSAGGPTIAVCGTGLDRVYPSQHAALADRIRASGALVSRFPPGTAPLPRNFPLRNQLISALSRGTLVVEAAPHSGSLITARHALKQGRRVFALPGAAGHPLSAGCHKLIREGARLVERPSEVLLELKLPFKKERVTRRRDGRGAAAAMDKAFEMLLDAVGFEPVTIDVLAIRTGLRGESIASMLLALELQGHIASYPGGRFGRIP